MAKKSKWMMSEEDIDIVIKGTKVQIKMLETELENYIMYKELRKRTLRPSQIREIEKRMKKVLIKALEDYGKYK